MYTMYINSGPLRSPSSLKVILKIHKLCARGCGRCCTFHNRLSETKTVVFVSFVYALLARDLNFQTLSGPGYSKVKALLVNVSLIFQTLISEIHQYFC